jgi:hypothetical protein
MWNRSSTSTYDWSISLKSGPASFMKSAWIITKFLTGMLTLNMQAVDVHVQDVDSLIFEESVGDTLSRNPILFIK